MFPVIYPGGSVYGTWYIYTVHATDLMCVVVCARCIQVKVDYLQSLDKVTYAKHARQH